jgi:hypothetical protein
MYQRGQQILIKPHLYANGVSVTQVIIDNVYDWGVRGFTYARVLGLDDLGDGLTRISIRVDWDDILDVISTPRRYDYYYPDLDKKEEV